MFLKFWTRKINWSLWNLLNQEKYESKKVHKKEYYSFLLNLTKPRIFHPHKSIQQKIRKNSCSYEYL